MDGSVVRSRATLVRAAFWAGMLGLLLGMATCGLGYAWAPEREEFGGVIRVGPSLVPKPGDPPLYVERGRFHLVNLREGEGMPEWMRSPWESEKLAAEARKVARRTGLVALYQVGPENCNNRPVRWQRRHQSDAIMRDAPNGYFATDCEHARYSKSGDRLFGAAWDHLATMPVRQLADGGVEVDTGRIQWPRWQRRHRLRPARRKKRDDR